MLHDIQDMLSAPFEDSDIEWRLQWADEEKGSGIAVPYVTNRAIQGRLDTAAGVGGWKNEFIPWHSDGKKASQLCGISIYFESRKEWVTKYDGAEDSDIEAVKGGLSDSMKRAAVQWGVGRYLYSMDTVYVDVEKRGKTTVIKKSSQPKLDEAHQRAVKKFFGPVKPAPAGQTTYPPKSEPPQQKQQAPQPQQKQQAPQPAWLAALREPPKPAAPPGQAPQPPKTAPQSPTQAAKQPQLTPLAAQQAARPSEPAAAMPEPGPSAKATGGSYRVIDIAVKPALNGHNTLVQLKTDDGKPFMAYMQGTDPMINKGGWIDNAVISKKANGGVIFYTLDSFEARAPMAA